MVKARNLRNGKMLAGSGVALAVLALAGCGGTAQTEARAASACPQVTILSDAAELTRFRAGGGRNPTDIELTASLTEVQSRCDPAPGGAGLDIILAPAFTAERGPAARGPTAEIPYMVAVVDEGEGQILSRAAYTLAVQFPSRASRSRSEGEELAIRIPGDLQAAAGKSILLGFVLTPEQLSRNRGVAASGR